MQDLLTTYKLIVLYMLDKVKFKLTGVQISDFVLGKEYTNYMTLQQVLSDLQDTELIKSETLANRTYYSITDEGKKTLYYFGNRINNIKSDIDEFLESKHWELQNESAVTGKYYSSHGGFTVELSATEKDIELVNIKLNIPSEEMAEAICDKWRNKNQQIYKYLMQELF